MKYLKNLNLLSLQQTTATAFPNAQMDFFASLPHINTFLHWHNKRTHLPFVPDENKDTLPILLGDTAKRAGQRGKLVERTVLWCSLPAASSGFHILFSARLHAK